MAITITEDGQSLIKGLHHVTSLASDANTSNHFFTRDLGLRRVKQTVNFDSPDTYHLYYGDKTGQAGTIMTCFPFPHIRRGRHGTGETGSVAFAVMEGSLPFWKKRLSALGLKHIREWKLFGEKRLSFSGPDGECLELVEMKENHRVPWEVKDIPPAVAIRGFHSVSLHLANHAAMAGLLTFMGYEETDRKENWHRFQIKNGNGADIIDIKATDNMKPAVQGAGSVHHIAFAVADREAQLVVREALLDAGYAVTAVVDRNYFWSIYFCAPGGILFEIATNGPGFDKDENVAHLGELLKLPRQHQHLREFLDKNLKPLQD